MKKRNRNLKRVLSLLLVMVLAMSQLSLTAFAAELDEGTAPAEVSAEAAYGTVETTTDTWTETADDGTVTEITETVTSGTDEEGNVIDTYDREEHSENTVPVYDDEGNVIGTSTTGSESTEGSATLTGTSSWTESDPENPTGPVQPSEFPEGKATGDDLLDNDGFQSKGDADEGSLGSEDLEGAEWIGDGITVIVTPGTDSTAEGEADWTGILAGKIEDAKPEGSVEADAEDLAADGIEIPDGSKAYKDPDTGIVTIVTPHYGNDGKLAGYSTTTVSTSYGDKQYQDDIGSISQNGETDDGETWRDEDAKTVAYTFDAPVRPLDREDGVVSEILSEDWYIDNGDGTYTLAAEGDEGAARVVVGYNSQWTETDPETGRPVAHSESVWGMAGTVTTVPVRTEHSADWTVITDHYVIPVERGVLTAAYDLVLDEDGNACWIKVTMGDVIAGDGHGNTTNAGGIMPDLSIEPGLGKTDTGNDLYNRPDATGKYYVWKVNAKSGLNVRTGPGSSNGKVGALENGAEVVVYEVKDGWARIGTDKWVSIEYADLFEPEASTTTGLNVRTGPGSSNSLVKTLNKGTVVNVLETKKVGTTEWARIGDNQWVSMDYLNVSETKGSTTLATVMDTVAYGGTKDIAVGEFVYFGELGLESAIRVSADGEDTWQAHQFIIRDSDGKVHYVYCADFDVDPRMATAYGSQLIDADTTGHWSDDEELNKEIAQHINAIALNGYWGSTSGTGSLESVKAMMKAAIELGKIVGISSDDVDGLTDGMALTATQAAIWSYADSGSHEFDTDDPFGRYWNTNKWDDSLLDSKLPVMNALYGYLRSLQSETYENKNLIGTESVTQGIVTVTDLARDDAGNAKVTDAGKSVYKTDVAFVLETAPSALNDDLLVTIKDSDGNAIGTWRLAGAAADGDKLVEGKDNVYTIRDIELADGVKITLNLHGTQLADKSAYLITAKDPSTKEANPSLSQTFVGVEDKTVSVNVSVDLTFEAKAPTAKLDGNYASESFHRDDEYLHTEDASSSWTTTENEVTVKATTKYEYKTESSWDDFVPDEPTPPTPSTPPTPPEEPDIPEEPTPLDPQPPVDPPTPPEEDVPEIEIPEEDPPLSDIPEEEDIPDEDVPMDDVPEEEDIPDEDVPLADVPKTGDDTNLALYGVLMAVSAIGLCGLAATGKKREEI